MTDPVEPWLRELLLDDPEEVALRDREIEERRAAYHGAWPPMPTDESVEAECGS